MKIDWINRPKGATHYDPASVDGTCWYRPNHHRGWDYWGAVGSNWIHCGCVSDQSRFIEVPAEFRWIGGKDLPPVGTVCEYQTTTWPTDQWEIRKILYISDYHVITAVEADGVERSVCAEIARFRPVRTPEQIAAEELAVIETWLDANIENLESVAQTLHQFGFRRTEQP